MARRSQPLLAPDRVKLYLSLVPYLAERGQVTVTEAASDFDVSPEDMRRMVQKLTVIGLPGEDGYWQLDQDLFNINWDLLDGEDVIELTNTVALRRVPRFTAREAAALLSGLRLARDVPGMDDGGVVTGLIEKLSRGASAAPADVIVAPSTTDDVRRVVAEGLRTHRAVQFTYRAPDADPLVRTVDPVKVHMTSGEWYLQGWCHLRRAMRTFHLARASDPVLLDLPAEHGAEHASELFGGMNTAPSTTPEDVAATIRFATDTAPLVGDYLSRAETTSEEGVTTARVNVGDPRSLKRLAARRGGAVEVVAPPAARAATAEWVRAALDQYTT